MNSNHIYDSNATMATRIIGSTAIRYEYLNDILDPIVDKIRKSEKIIFHVDLEGILYGLYRKKDLPAIMDIEYDTLVKNIVVGVVNVLAHYRKYFASYIGVDNEIFVYWNYKLPGYQSTYCPAYRNKMYEKYNKKNIDFGVIYQATRKAAEMISNLLQYIEGIYWVDNAKYDTYASIAYTMTTRKYSKYYHLIFSRTMILSQLVGKRVAQLVHGRQYDIDENGVGQYTSRGSYLITTDNVYKKAFFTSKQKPWDIQLPAYYVPIVWTLSKYSDLGIDKLIYAKIPDTIRHLEKLYNAEAIADDTSIRNVIEALIKDKPKFFPNDIDECESIIHKAIDRYKVLNLKLAAKGISKAQVLSMYRGVIDLYDQNALEKLNDQLTAEDSRENILDINALNQSHAVMRFSSRKQNNGEFILLRNEDM